MYNVIENKKIIDKIKRIAIVLHTKSINHYHIKRRSNYYYITVKGSTKLQIESALEVLVNQGYRVVALKYINSNNSKGNNTENNTVYNPKSVNRCIASIVVAPPQPSGPLPPLPDPDGNMPKFKKKRRGRKK